MFGRTYILSRNFVDISCLIQPSQAKLGLYIDVLYFMSFSLSLFFEQSQTTVYLKLRRHMQREKLTVHVLMCHLIWWWGLHHFVRRQKQHPRGKEFL